MHIDNTTTTLVELSKAQLIDLLKSRGVIPFNASAENTVITPCIDSLRGELFSFTTMAVRREFKADSFMRIQFKPQLACTVGDAISEALNIAQTFEHEVCFTFNGVRFNALPTSTPAELFAVWAKREEVAS